MASGDDDTFTFGRMLEHLRTEVRRLSQAELAERMCAELNERNRRLPNPPKSITTNAMRTSMSMAEQNKRRLDGPRSEVAAHVLRVPAIWFDNPAPTWTAFLTNLDAWLQQQLAETVQWRTPREPPVVTEPPRFFHKISSLPKAPDHAVFRQKALAYQELNQTVFGATGSAVYCLKGPLGIGKSTLLHNWCVRESHRLKDRGVLAIHCVDKTGDDLREEFIDYYKNCGIRDPASYLPDLLSNFPLVLVLDAIERFDRGDISGVNLSPQLLLEPILGPAFDRSANLKVVVTYSPEAVAGTPELLGFLRSLAGDTRYHEVELGGLHPDDGAEFLSKSGLNVSKEILRQLSEDVEGNPALLAAFIASASRSGEPVAERVQHLSLFGKEAIAPNEPTVRTELFRELIVRVRNHSPEAFTALLLLTACHDGLEPDQLQHLVSKLLADAEFLEACKLERGGAGTRMDILGGPLAGLIRITPRVKNPGAVAAVKGKGKRPVVKSLHALARLEIDNLLPKFAEPVGRIIVHAAVVDHLFRLVPGQTDETYVPNTVDIERYHNILHHLTNMYDISASAGADKSVTQTANKSGRIAQKPGEKSDEHFSTTAVQKDPDLFLERVFSDVMMLHLGNESRVIGRQLGHFERKLAMLGLFYERTDAPGNSRLSVKSGLGQNSKRALFYETAVVANYTGRLTIAHKAVREAIETSSRNGLPSARQLKAAVESSLRGGKHSEALPLLTADLNNFTALLNVSATTYCREGHIDVAHRLLDRPFASAIKLIDDVRTLVTSTASGATTAPRRVRSNLQGILLGLRRIASKLGQVLTYKNDLAAASAAYDAAMALEALRSGMRILRGETGRAYCRFLLASHDDLKRAEVSQLINNNITHSKALRRNYELVEWLIELVHFECRYGSTADAQIVLAEIDELTTVRGVGLSFSAQKELEIERCRVDITIGDRPRSDRLKVGLRSCQLSGHELLACDTQLLLSLSERSRDLQVFWQREAEEIMKRTGYLLPKALGLLN